MNTLDLVKRAAPRAPNEANLRSVVVALDKHGAKLGLDQPHRLVQFLAQLAHESAWFRYDREVWGPTPAQKRYDTRTDLGNTAALDGDGKLYMGRTGIQITGKANYAAFRDWCRKLDPKVPDFVQHPDLVNTDPWEGLGPLWYWDTRRLNRFADQGDVENITLKINGGRNGYDDRLACLSRLSLARLGYKPADISAFQRDTGIVVDGLSGPKTRAAMHQALVKLTAAPARAMAVQAAPVVEEKPVPIAPAAIDKPVTQTSGFWERLTTIIGLTGIGGASWLGDWKVILAIAGTLIVVALLGLLLHARIVAAVKAIKEGVTA
jgi:putative chitinase